MKRVTFFPQTEPEKRQWLDSFKLNLGDFSNKLGIDPQEARDLAQEATESIADIDEVEQKSSELDAAIQKRNARRELFLDKVNSFVKRAKVNPSYTKSDGELINVETAPTTKVKSNKGTAGVDKLKPTIGVSERKVTFKFNRPTAHVVAIYCRRGGESNFTLLNKINGAIFEDLRANLNNADAEKREYCFTLSKSDKESGRSAVYSVAVAQ